MGTHRHQVTAFLLDPFDNFIARLAKSEFRRGVYSRGLKFAPDFFQISGVFRDFSADGVRPIGAGRPAVGHVQQHDPAVRPFRQGFDVLNDGTVAGRGVQGYENFFIHGRSWL